MVRTTGLGIQDSGFRRLLCNLIPALALCGLLVAGLIKAQMPANTPTYSVNAKWVTDRGSQVYNVKAYGAKCDGSTDDSAAFASALAAIPAGGGTLFIPPSATPCNISSARVAVTTSNTVISGYGATLLCTVSDDCVTLGSLSNPNAVINAAIKGLIIEPGAGSLGHSAIRDNGQVSLIEDVKFVYNGGNKFNHLIENDDDQAQVVKHPIVEVAGVVRCDSTFCGSALWGPGPYSTNAGVTFLSDAVFNLGCSGNAVDWWNGNELTVRGSVIQGFNQYAFRIGPTTYPHDTLEGVYVEQGVCTNPLGNVGSSGIIAIGTSVYNFGGTLGGGLPTFPQAGTTGGTWYSYYIVGHSSGNATPPMAAGGLNNGNATINSTNKVTGTWDDFEQGCPTCTYDVLRYQSTNPRTAPSGTGNWAVATGLAESSVCASGVCTFVDTVTSPSSYTVPGFYGWLPEISMWPGTVVLSPNSGSCNLPGRYYGDAQFSGSTFTNLCGNTSGTVTLTVGPLDFGGDWVPFAPGLVTMPPLTDPNTGNTGATVFAGSGGGVKGQVNFGNTGGPTDVVTLADSNLAKTYSHADEHPAYDVGDAALGRDATGGTWREPGAISYYIDSLPDDQSWLERLSSSIKTFKVPLGSFSVAQLSAPSVGVGDVATGGSLPPNTQECYRVTTLDNLGETTPSNEACVTTANDGNSTHQVHLDWTLFTGVTSFKVYGRTSGSEQLLATVVAARDPGNLAYYSWYDTGALTPSGAMPMANTTGQVQAGGAITAPAFHGNADTAAYATTAGGANSLINTPSQCTGGLVATGIAASGNANCGGPPGAFSAGLVPAWQRGNTGYTGNTGATSIPTTLSSTTAGDTLIASCTSYPGGGGLPSSVTDTTGDTFTLEVSTTKSGQGAIYTYVALNVGGQVGTNTITCHYASGVYYSWIIVDEYSNVSSVDKTTYGQNDTSGHLITLPSMTTSVNGEVIYSVGLPLSGNMTPGSGFTCHECASGTAISSESLVQSTAGSIAVTWADSYNNDQDTVTAVTLEPAIGSTPVSVYISLTGQSSSISATSMGSPIKATLFRACGAIQLTTAGTSGTVSSSITYNDINATSETDTLVPSVTFGTITNHGGGCIEFYATTGTPIQYSTTVTSAVGSPVYAAQFAVEKIGQ